jgi:hypothetical protein
VTYRSHHSILAVVPSVFEWGRRETRPAGLDQFVAGSVGDILAGEPFGPPAPDVERVHAATGPDAVAVANVQAVV